MEFSNRSYRSILQLSLFMMASWATSVHSLAHPLSPCSDPPTAAELAEHPPEKLSEAGVFSDLSSLSTCSGVIEYTVQAPLWSDGAAKHRWVKLPGNEKITFRPDDPWTFPVGTIFTKHFEIQTPGKNGVRIETRLLILASEDEWVGYTYRWNEDQRDAILIPDTPYPTESDLKIPDPRSHDGFRTQKWQFPTRTDCNRCHNPISGGALGPRTEQLNFAGTDGKNQLEKWDAQGLFSSRIGSVTKYPAYANPYDPSANLTIRARSYIASNCAHCHQPGAPVPSNMDLRFHTPASEMRALNAKPMAGDLGVPNAFIIKPGKKEQSVLWHRVSRRGGPATRQMPPIASLLPDAQAVELIGNWIDRLKP